MKLPPEEQRVTNHLFQAWGKSRRYKREQAQKEQKEWIRKQRLFIWRAHACMRFGFPGKREKDTVLLFYRKKHNCNPMYFNRFLLEYASAEYEYVWVVNDPERIFVPEHAI